MKNTLIPLLILCVTAACTSSPESKEVSGSPVYEYKTFKITSDNTVSQEDGTDTAYYLVTYPEFSDPQINQYVQNNLVLDSGHTSLEQMGEEFIRGYDKFYDDVEFKRTWFLEKRDSVAIQTKNYIGFSTFFYSYTGGAHGNYYTRYHNYDITTHKEIQLNDIVAENDQAALTTIAEGFFRKQENLTDTASLSNGYFFEDAKFFLPDNFILQKQGLLFLYTIYEIKPYVNGETKLLIPYSAIETLLTESGERLREELK